jgi:hypothetical protein
MNDPRQETGIASPREHGWAIFLLLCLAAGLGLAAILNVEPLLSANDRSRWATVWSLAVKDIYQIDEIIQRDGWDTIDKVRHEEHFYSSKPPLLSTLVSWVYRGVRAVTGWRFPGDTVGLAEDAAPANDTKAVTRTILILVNLVPFLLAIWALARFLPRYTNSKTTLWLILIAAAFGTYLSPYIVTLNNHTVAAASIIFSMIPCARIVCDDERRPLLFLTAGFFAAFAAANELPAALWGVIVFGLLAWKSPRLTLLYFIPAATVPLAAFFWTNYEATGGVKPFYAYYGTEKYEYVYEGVPSYWVDPKGIDANQETPAVYLMHCTIGHHGIFSLTPIFLLTLWSWLSVSTWKSHRIWTMHVVGIVLTIAVMGFYLTRTQNYNYGGNTAGLRWAFWLIPFWLLALVPLLDRFARRRWFLAIAGVLMALSVASAASASANPWQPSWLYTLMKDWKWIDYDTRPPELPRKLTTFVLTLPPVDEADPAWIEFSTPEADGTLTILRLQDGGMWANQQRPIRKVVATWKNAGIEESSQTFYVDEEKFNAGQVPREFLVWPEGDPDAIVRFKAETFFRNLPQSRPYNADHIRYVKTPLRADAFRCQQAASRVNSKLPGRRPLSYRSDVWICDQLPFGVLRFQSIVSDPATGDTVEYRRFDVSNASWFYETSPSK